MEFTSKHYITNSTVRTLGRENWDKFRAILNCSMHGGRYDDIHMRDWVRFTPNRNLVWVPSIPNDGERVTSDQILEFIKSKEPKMRKVTDKVSITITLGELARAYAVMSTAGGKIIGSGEDTIFLQARQILDESGAIYTWHSTDIRLKHYGSYQDEWLKDLFRDETAEKIEKLQEIINNAQAELDALKKTL